MEDLKQISSWSFLGPERAEAKLLHLEEMLTATHRERDEAREQLEKYCNMVTNTQQNVVTSMDRSQWPDTNLAGPDFNIDPYSTMDYHCSYQSSPNQFLWNSTPAHHFDLPPDVHLHQHPTSYLEFECSNIMEFKDQPLYHQNLQHLSLVEQQQFESHLLASPPSILGSNMSEPPEADLEVSEDTLPEKGKLLQAVMQAGPLLQTLLLTGQLPKWKHRPPALGSVEIPKMSMSSFPTCPLPIGPLVHHVLPPQNPVDPLQVNSAVSLFITTSAHASQSTKPRLLQSSLLRNLAQQLH